MKLTLQLAERSYDIVLKRGSLANAGSLANLRRRVLVVTDSGVPPAYAKTVAAQCGEGSVFALPPGEATKSADNWQAILRRMMELSFTRGDAVAAVGGGVTGDLAGFAAATYMRGVDFFQFPTTTLSQIDSSIGGKTAINMDHTKNIVGAFHQPRLVIVDPDTLATLPRRHFVNGLAEALKSALIGDADLFAIFEQGDPDADIERILAHCLLYKKNLVERDETEQGERKVLNFGHTIGHGIEAACGLSADGSGLLHGECVALGMLPMIENKTLRRKVRDICDGLGLPAACPASPQEILPYIAHDKKRSGDTITVVKVKKPGEAYLEQVTLDEIQLLLENLPN